MKRKEINKHQRVFGVKTEILRDKEGKLDSLGLSWW